MTDETNRMRQQPDAKTTGDRVERGDEAPPEDAVQRPDDTLGPAGTASDASDVARQPGWRPDQLETADRSPGSPEHPEPAEIEGGYRGGAGPDWNKGQMEFDDAQERIPKPEMEESELGPWGSAEAAERARREKERGAGD